MSLTKTTDCRTALKDDSKVNGMRRLDWVICLMHPLDPIHLREDSKVNGIDVQVQKRRLMLDQVFNDDPRNETSRLS